MGSGVLRFAYLKRACVGFVQSPIPFPLASFYNKPYLTSPWPGSASVPRPSTFYFWSLCSFLLVLIGSGGLFTKRLHYYAYLSLLLVEKGSGCFFVLAYGYGVLLTSIRFWNTLFFFYCARMNGAAAGARARVA